MTIHAPCARTGHRQLSTSCGSVPAHQQVYHRLGINETLLTCDLGFTAWLESHLGNEREGLLFGVAAWYLRKWRNEKTFHNLSQEDHILAHRIGCWTYTIRNVHLNDKAFQEQPWTKTSQQLTWNPPLVQWMSIHTDGSVKQPGSLPATGELIGDWTLCGSLCGESWRVHYHQS
ncbi:unnamed protein product [Linum trigynum]|uniref:Uncharacterized protein n=1 Tax=Linum trigynum TaxID=586398 RepID=A0AAV2GP42_9ROSI